MTCARIRVTRRVQLGFSCVARRLLWRALRCTQKYTFISFCCVSLPSTICLRVSHLCKVYEDTAGVIVRECVYSECKELVVVVEVWFESPSLGREKNYQTDISRWRTLLFSTIHGSFIRVPGVLPSPLTATASGEVERRVERARAKTRSRARLCRGRDP